MLSAKVLVLIVCREVSSVGVSHPYEEGIKFPANFTPVRKGGSHPYRQETTALTCMVGRSVRFGLRYITSNWHVFCRKPKPSLCRGGACGEEGGVGSTQPQTDLLGSASSEARSTKHTTSSTKVGGGRGVGGWGWQGNTRERTRTRKNEQQTGKRAANTPNPRTHAHTHTTHRPVPGFLVKRHLFFGFRAPLHRGRAVHLSAHRVHLFLRRGAPRVGGWLEYSIVAPGVGH